MIRVIIICEGETEKQFCKDILSPYFIPKGIQIQPPLIKKSMGGIVKWSELKKQVESHLKSDTTAYVTTFIDYYGLYKKYKFPNWDEAEAEPNKVKRMEILEKGMYDGIEDALRYRFFPNIQLHEFEGLLFNDIDVFHQQIPKNELVGLDELKQTFARYDNPEMINNNKETSPSHRLERIILGYDKVIYGNILAEAIGLEKMRAKSPRFNLWLKCLEGLMEEI